MGLRYDFAKPYIEVADRWSFFNPDLANPRRAAIAVRCSLPDTVKIAANAARQSRIITECGGPASGLAWQFAGRTVLRASYSIMYTRRGAVGGRGGSRNGTGLLGFSAQPSFPSVDGFSPAFDWDDGVPGYQKAPFFQSDLNTGFTTERPTGGGAITATSISEHVRLDIKTGASGSSTP